MTIVDLIHLLQSLCWWLFHAFVGSESWTDGNLRAFDDVLAYKVFAGELWKAAGSDYYAAPWAVVVDNILDHILKLQGLDPQVIRGDH